MRKVLKNAKGFTLMEVVVVLGIIALLTAIMTPLILDYVEEARKAKAANDVKAIGTAIHQLHQDTKKWPVSDGTNDLVFLYSGDTAPSGGSLPDDANSDSLDDHLITNGAGYPLPGEKFAWNGSYIDSMTNDPWGNPYVVYVEKLAEVSGTHAWVLSAGPDGDYETGPSDAKLQGNDIGKKIK